MPLLKKLILSIAIVTGIFSIISLTMPSDWKVSRSVEIKAPPAAIFPYLNDLHKWSEWYPWSRSTDVSMSVTYAGPETGTGSVKSWGGSSMKNGRIEITQSVHNMGIRYIFQSSESKIKVNGSLQIVKTKDGSMVTWEDSGNTGKNIFARFFASNLDSVIGKKFETGLANLKKAVEK